jgi:hypothetical protein
MVMNEKLVKVGERAAMQEVCARVSCSTPVDPRPASAVLSCHEHNLVLLPRLPKCLTHTHIFLRAAPW